MMPRLKILRYCIKNHPYWSAAMLSGVLFTASLPYLPMNEYGFRNNEKGLEDKTTNSIPVNNTNLNYHTNG